MATLLDGAALEEGDVRRVLAAMRSRAPRPIEVDPSKTAAARERLQRDLQDGRITIEAFSRSWRRLERPTTQPQQAPDELRLARARRALSEFGTLWRNPAVPDRLREEALREIFERLDVDGPQIVGAHPLPNENAWLLGLVAIRQERMLTQRVLGVVGARGVAPS